MLEHALMPEDDLQRLYDPSNSKLSVNGSVVSNPENTDTIQACTNVPKLQAMLELRELKQFHKVFLQN